MRLFIFSLVSLLQTFALATEGTSVSEFSCKSNDGTTVIEGVRQECFDQRYAVWQRNGCYLVSLKQGDTTLSYEMVRNVPFSRESASRIYSFMTFDKSEAVLQGMMIEFQPEGTEGKYRFDTRPNHKSPFKVQYGYCLTKE